MEINFTNYLYNEQEINFTIENKTITGITGTFLTDYIDILMQRKQGKGTILTNEENLGFTYATLDKYIREGVIDDPEIKKLIDRKHEMNLFKLQLMPTFKPEI